MIGQKLSPILEEIEFAIIEFDSEVNTKPNYSNSALRSASKILISVVMDKMWELQEKEGIPQEDRENMAVAAGNELRNYLKKFCDVDSFDFYKTTIVGENGFIHKKL